MRQYRFVVAIVVGIVMLVGVALVLPRQRAHAQSDWLTSTSLTLAPVVKGLNQPTYVTGAPDGTNRLFILEKGGLLKVADANGQVQPTPFLDLRQSVSDGGEEGLLGLAFDPNFVGNRYVYLDYTALDRSVQVVRYTVSTDNPDLADPATAQVVLSVPKKGKYHNAGMLAFGPDGYLYISVGDDQDSDRSQDLGVLTGKILRIDVDSTQAPYAIPSTNPFVGSDARGEVWSYGLRNPWRFSFDRATGDIWIGDVHHVDEGPGGNNNWESVEFQPAGVGGLNYGFPAHMFHCSDVSNCLPDGVTPPVTQFDHNMRCSITGGYVYRGAAVPALVGTYLFGDLCTGGIFRLNANQPQPWSKQMELAYFPIQISSFGEDAAGELYVADIENGTIYRIVDASLP